MTRQRIPTYCGNSSEIGEKAGWRRFNYRVSTSEDRKHSKYRDISSWASMSVDQGHIHWQQWQANCSLAMVNWFHESTISLAPGSDIKRVLVVSKAAARKVTALAEHQASTVRQSAADSRCGSFDTWSSLLLLSDKLCAVQMREGCAAAAIHIQTVSPGRNDSGR
jgi:hypothetical protein